MEYVNPNTDRNISNDTERYYKVTEDIDTVVNDFAAWQTKARRNFDFYRNEQWTAAEKQSFAEQGRHPYVFNEMSHKIEHLVGTQMQTRTDSKIIPREPGDSVKAEILQNVVKWCEQTNNIEILESEIFLDGIVKGFGASVIRWSNKDMFYGYPETEKIPFEELYWDLTAKKPDLSDAQWMARQQYISKAKAAELFPDKANIIYKSDANGIRGFGVSNGNVGPSRSYTNPVNNVRIRSYSSNEDRDTVSLIEHYEKQLVNIFIVSDDYLNKHTKFYDRKQAEEYHAGLIDGYAEIGFPIVDMDQNLLVRFSTRPTYKIWQTIIVGDKVIVNQQTSLSEYPFFVFFPYYDDGTFWAFADSLIDPQRLVNRMIAQWDHAIGTSVKNTYTAIQSLLSIPLETASRMLNKTGAVIPVYNHSAIAPMAPPPLNPALFQATEFGIGRMNDYAGGRNALGLQENAAESGRAVQVRAEQGGLARLPLFDRMRVWRRNMTQQMVWYIQNYMPSKQISGILGSSDINVIPIDDDIIDSIREVEMNIIIDEAVNSASMKERYMMQLNQAIIASQGQIPAEVWIPMMLEFSDLPENKKQTILASIDREKAYASMQAELAKYQQMVQSVQDSQLKSAMRDAEKDGNKLEDMIEDNKMKIKELEYSEKELERAKPTNENEDTNAMAEQFYNKNLQEQM